jgi:type I restriction enzyme S subunit
MSDWQQVALGEICSIEIGGTPSRSDPRYWWKSDEDGIRLPWVSISDMKGKVITDTKESITEIGALQSNCKHVPKGTLLMSFKLTIGRLAFAGRDLYTNEAISAIRPFKDVCPEFLFYGLQNWNLIGDSDQAVKGATLNKQKLQEIPCLLPPLPEQKKIAEILSGIDRALHQIGLYSTKLDMALKAILYEYPKNFSTAAVRLHDCAFLQAGGTPDRSNPNFWGGNIPWVKTGEVNYNTITRTEETITEAGLLASSARLLPEGSILMAMYGQGITRGRVAKLGIPAATNQACLAINSRIPEINNDFIYNILSSKYDELRGQVQEGTQKNLSKSIIGNQEIPILEGARQAEFCRICAKINDTRGLTSKKLRSLQMLKQSLSSDLLSGRKRVTV